VQVIASRKTTTDLTFTDDTQLPLGARTIVAVDPYPYRKKEENFSLSVPQGIVRAKTGLLAKRWIFSVRCTIKVVREHAIDPAEEQNN
jgi:hypothetical protein